MKKITDEMIVLAFATAHDKCEKVIDGGGECLHTALYDAAPAELIKNVESVAYPNVVLAIRIALFFGAHVGYRLRELQEEECPCPPTGAFSVIPEKA